MQQCYSVNNNNTPSQGIKAICLDPSVYVMQQYFVPKPVYVPCTIYEDFQDGYSAFVRVMKVD